MTTNNVTAWWLPFSTTGNRDEYRVTFTVTTPWGAELSPLKNHAGNER